MTKDISTIVRSFMKHAIFLDRDGVINKAIMNNGRPFSPRKINNFEIMTDVEEALNRFHELGYVNIIITNQPDIARGLINKQTINEMHSLIRKRLTIDDIFVCPHDDSDKCLCRKPKPGMIMNAVTKWHIDLSNSYFIGDTWKDVYAGKSAGCSTILLDRLYNVDLEPDYRVTSLLDVYNIIRRSR